MIEFEPYARLFMAVAPFATAILLRVILGRTRLTRLLISLSTSWFFMNVLMAPYAARVRQDLFGLPALFR